MAQAIPVLLPGICCCRSASVQRHPVKTVLSQTAQPQLHGKLSSRLPPAPFGTRKQNVLKAVQMQQRSLVQEEMGLHSSFPHHLLLEKQKHLPDAEQHPVKLHLSPSGRAAEAGKRRSRVHYPCPSCSREPAPGQATPATVQQAAFDPGCLSTVSPPTISKRQREETVSSS